MEKIIFENQLIGSHKTFVKAVALMIYLNVTDFLFLPLQNRTILKIKGIGYWQEKFSYMQFNNREGWENIAEISKQEFNSLKNKIKLECFLSIIDTDTPKSCAISFFHNEEKLALRCSFHPTNWGESLSIRIIRPSFFLENKIDLTGLTIIFGPTGSGKTTIFYSIINSFKGHVVTLEDPVEYNIGSTCQTDVTIIGYEEAIKSVLRQTPDLIGIGEIRDKISMNAAIRSALTGHKVITTIHSGSIDELVARIQDLGGLFINSVLTKCIEVKNFQFKVWDGENLKQIFK